MKTSILIRFLWRPSWFFKYDLIVSWNFNCSLNMYSMSNFDMSHDHIYTFLQKKLFLTKHDHKQKFKMAAKSPKNVQKNGNMIFLNIMVTLWKSMFSTFCQKFSQKYISPYTMGKKTKIWKISIFFNFFNFLNFKNIFFLKKCLSREP